MSHKFLNVKIITNNTILYYITQSVIKYSNEFCEKHQTNNEKHTKWIGLLVAILKYTSKYIIINNIERVSNFKINKILLTFFVLVQQSLLVTVYKVSLTTWK